MIELFEFQQQAATTIAERFTQYMSDPVRSGTKSNPRVVPFFQALSSITASGKTVIMADAVANMCGSLPVQPVVLWLSKGKVVVEQTLANLLPAGKYHHLLGNAEVRPLGDFDRDEVAELGTPIIYFATVGTFNQKDKENGSLAVYRCEVDTADQSVWDALKLRLTASNIRRPLVVVYDEAHNLSDQQTDLLMELEPDAFLLASATMSLPGRLAREVEALKANGWSDETLITSIDAAAVADSGLVKSGIILAGYQSPMEETLSALISDLREAERDAARCGLKGRPKAIYVSNTNIVAGNADQTDDPKQPFAQRQAPPILIWRHLVDVHGVNPEDIAVYCSLKMDKEYPAPEGFRLFKGGDKDYSDFTRGDYQHIIFNLGLQEGWDDPYCYFAYIDKSMESRAQVKQVIGRVLRQPDARHYPAERLNTAHFYLRVDRNQVFSEIVDSVDQELRAGAPDIKVVVTKPGKARPVEMPVRRDLTVPTTALDPSSAVAPIAALIDRMTDYRDDTGVNTVGEGSRATVKRLVGYTSDEKAEWESFEQSSRMLARWVFQREVKQRYPGALGVAPTSGPKFDALVGLGSNAAEHVAKTAAETVDLFLENVRLIQKARDPYTIGPQLVREDGLIKYGNSLHEGYDGLNGFEKDFAHALDRTGLPWCRNPSRTGYRIPLATMGPTAFFYPDFLVWDQDDVYAIDTKGGHLISEAAARKLLWIEPPAASATKIFVKLVAEGKWRPDATLVSSEGYSLWGIQPGSGRTTSHFETLDELLSGTLTGRRG